MGSTFLFIDAGLNLTWAVVSLTVLLCWRAEWTRQHRQAVVAILSILVLLFPAISAADDLAEHTMIYDLSPSSLTLKNANEFNQVVTPALLTCQPGHGLAPSLQEAIGDSLGSESPGSRILIVLLGSASGIHSPPQF